MVGLVCLGLCVLAGCGGSGGGDDTQSGNGALSASGGSVVTADTPITLQNYVNHPKIKAIRGEVEGIDNDLAHGDLFSEDNPNVCEASLAKVTGARGQIVKIVENLGDGGARTQAYYGEKPVDSIGTGDSEPGPLLFVFQVSGTMESRVYFDAHGNKLWQVVRQTGGADRLPQGNEVYQPNRLHSDPEKWFASGDC